jgi:hypothetical protein
MRLIIPADSIFRPTANLFLATFNVPALGQYDFSVAANQNVSVLPIDATNLYFISIVNFSATVPESAYIENLTTDLPQIRFKTKQNNKPLYGGTYPLAKYLVTNEVGTFFESKQSKDELLADFSGILDQNASLVPFTTIRAVVALNIWEIHDQKFINEFHHIVKTKEEISKVVVPSSWERRV